jgi:hypothetical protein
MDIRSLTFGSLVMGGQSLGGRQDQIFGGKHHGGALVMSPARRYYSLTLPFHMLFASFC